MIGTVARTYVRPGQYGHPLYSRSDLYRLITRDKSVFMMYIRYKWDCTQVEIYNGRVFTRAH
jgi:hypothetical protein